MTPEIYRSLQAAFVSSTNLKAGDFVTISRLWKWKELGFDYGVGDNPETISIEGVKFKINKIHSDSIETDYKLLSVYDKTLKIPFFVIDNILPVKRFEINGNKVKFNDDGITCGCQRVSIRELKYIREKVALDKKYVDLEYCPNIDFVNDPTEYIVLFGLNNQPIHDANGELGVVISMELFEKCMKHLDILTTEMKMPIL